MDGVLETNKIRLGYVPLLDCVALLWAKERGFFQELGLDVTLINESSWASLRDRLAFGLLDAAHCLSAMLPAATLGRDQIGIQLKTPLVLSSTRAYISLSQSLSYQLEIKNGDSALLNAKKLITHVQNGHTVTLAHVFQNSIHHYCLREWLALANTDIAHKISFKTLPPPSMVEALGFHLIDGFCVGEPWNTQSEIEGIGQIIASSQNIIPTIADKVLATTDNWANQHPNTLIAMTSAILKAQHELSSLENYEPVWLILNKFNIVRFNCSAQVHVSKYFEIEKNIRTLVVNGAEPKLNDFVWLFQQMQKWSVQQDHFDQDIIQTMSQHCIAQHVFQNALKQVNF